MISIFLWYSHFICRNNSSRIFICLTRSRVRCECIIIFMLFFKCKSVKISKTDASNKQTSSSSSSKNNHKQQNNCKIVQKIIWCTCVRYKYSKSVCARRGSCKIEWKTLSTVLTTSSQIVSAHSTPPYLLSASLTETQTHRIPSCWMLHISIPKLNWIEYMRTEWNGTTTTKIMLLLQRVIHSNK